MSVDSLIPVFLLIHPGKLWKEVLWTSWFFFTKICINKIYFVCCFLQVLKTVKKEILKGCKIVFSRVFPTKYQAENHHLWKMAEQLGATCATELDSSVTHVVSNDVGTEKSRWAVKHNKFLVLPRWIEAANYMWQKKPEENFSVKPNEELITPVCSNANS